MPRGRPARRPGAARGADLGTQGLAHRAARRRRGRPPARRTRRRVRRTAGRRRAWPGTARPRRRARRRRRPPPPTARPRRGSHGVDVLSPEPPQPQGLGAGPRQPGRGLRAVVAGTGQRLVPHLLAGLGERGAPCQHGRAGGRRHPLDVAAELAEQQGPEAQLALEEGVPDPGEHVDDLVVHRDRPARSPASAYRSTAALPASRATRPSRSHQGRVASSSVSAATSPRPAATYMRAARRAATLPARAGPRRRRPRIASDSSQRPRS